jgi:hypothetical protein
LVRIKYLEIILWDIKFHSTLISKNKSQLDIKNTKRRGIKPIIANHYQIFVNENTTGIQDKNIVLTIVAKSFLTNIIKFRKMKKFLVLGAFVSCKEKAVEAPVEAAPVEAAPVETPAVDTTAAMPADTTAAQH